MNDILTALMIPFPDGFEGFDAKYPTPTTFAEAQERLKKGETLPWADEAAMLADRDAQVALRDRKTSVQAERDNMKADFMDLDPELRGAYWETFSAINQMLDAGDFNAAKSAIRTVEVKKKLSAKNITAFEKERKRFEAKLDALNQS